MQTKFDVDDIAYVPVRVIRITAVGPAPCEPEYKVRPLSVENTIHMTFLENEIFNKEDICNGKAEDEHRE